jgi:hypothetical protein
MNETNKPPSFFSLEFHTSFFPALLLRLLHPEKRKYKSIFADHMALEYPVLAVISIIAGVYGTITALDSGSIIGWVCGILGLGGFVYFLYGSIRSRKQIRPSFEYFRVIIFFFFVILGITVGLEIGMVYHLSYGFRIILVLAGLVLGYVSGIGGGLWIQYLGWIVSLLEILGIMAIAGMVFFDILLLTVSR